MRNSISQAGRECNMARPKRKGKLSGTPSAPTRRIYKAGGYSRLSLEDSGKPGTDTIETQQELIRDYIEAQEDMCFCGLYSDNGRTGTNFERPEFDRLMEDIRKGKIDCVVVKDLSRFGRNYLETGNYLMRIFPFLDVRFVAVNDHFDTLTAERSSDGYMIPLKNIINDVYSKDISRKIIPALRVKKQNGEFLGTWAAYGYRKCADDRHRIVPDEETAPVVREIFQWRAEGMGYSQIVRRLTELEIPSPARYHYLKGEAKSEKYANTRWTTTVIKRLLTNEVYLGHLIQGRKRTSLCEGIKEHAVPKEEWIVVRNTHVPLVDEETFQAVQAVEQERHDTYFRNLGKYDGLGKTPNILRGLVYCPDCKKPMFRYKNVVNKGVKVIYVYICPTHSVNPSACPKKYIRETLLLEVLWDAIRREIEQAVNFEALVRQFAKSDASTRQNRALEQELVSARQALFRAERLYNSLYENYVDHLMTEQEYAQLKRQYQADMETAKEKIADVEKRLQLADRATIRNPWLTSFGRFRGETELTEEMAHALIDRIEVDASNHISVFLSFRDEYEALRRRLEREALS